MSNFEKYKVTHHSTVKISYYSFRSKNTFKIIMPKISKFDKISEFCGAWGTPKHKDFFKRILHKLFFYEMTQLEGVRLTTFKSRSNMDHPIVHAVRSCCDCIYPFATGQRQTLTITFALQ